MEGVGSEEDSVFLECVGKRFECISGVGFCFEGGQLREKGLIATCLIVVVDFVRWIL